MIEPTPSPDQDRPDFRASDPIAALFLNYFCASISIRETVAHLLACRKTISDPYAQILFAQSRIGPIIGAWQASLHPVINGFKKLGLRDEAVEALIEQHVNYIRATAKVVHAYHDHTTYITQSQSLAERQRLREIPNLDTAAELHDAFEEFFSQYMFDQGYVSGNDIHESESASKH